jgi:hypothetical protein
VIYVERRDSEGGAEESIRVLSGQEAKSTAAALVQWGRDGEGFAHEDLFLWYQQVNPRRGMAARRAL